MKKSNAGILKGILYVLGFIILIGFAWIAVPIYLVVQWNKGKKSGIPMSKSYWIGGGAIFAVSLTIFIVAVSTPSTPVSNVPIASASSMATSSKATTQSSLWADDTGSQAASSTPASSAPESKVESKAPASSAAPKAVSSAPTSSAPQASSALPVSSAPQVSSEPTVSSAAPLSSEVPASSAPAAPSDPPESKQPAADTKEEITIYITPTGKKYHYDSNCNNGTYKASTLQKALDLGLTPCKKCAGG